MILNPCMKHEKFHLKFDSSFTPLTSNHGFSKLSNMMISVGYEVHAVVVDCSCIELHLGTYCISLEALFLF